MKNTKSFKQGKLLEEQRDNLRSELKGLHKQGLFDDKKSKLLQRLDDLFFLHCRNNELELSKFGRLK